MVALVGASAARVEKPACAAVVAVWQPAVPAVPVEGGLSRPGVVAVV